MDTERERLEDRFEVGGILGKGGFSAVRRAVRRADGETFAVKTIRKSRHNLFIDALIQNEMNVMDALRENVHPLPHPNIVNFGWVLDSSESVHIGMELCDGGELFDRIIKQERYSEAAAASVIRQIATGLQSLHNAGIVHRDLKPENCLFKTPAEDSPLKIIDFGLSHVAGNSNRLFENFGSRDYCAPEMLDSSPSSSPASDMWSLGVILYILLSGYHPFYECEGKPRKHELITRAIYDFKYHTWRSISDSAKELISSLLRVDAHRRLKAENVLEHPWVIGDRAKNEPLQSEVVLKLKSFNARMKFKAAGFASIASNKFMRRIRDLRAVFGKEELSESEVGQINAYFKRLSGNGRSVNLVEFGQVLLAMNMGNMVPIANRIFEVFDDNRDGTVDMREIVCGLSSLRRTHGDDALRLCFKVYDSDNSGTISREELAAMLRVLPDEFLPWKSCQAENGQVSRADELFDRIDLNGDGELSFEEFKAAIQSESYLNITDVLRRSTSI